MPPGQTLGIVRHITGHRRNRLFVYGRYKANSQGEYRAVVNLDGMNDIGSNKIGRAGTHKHHWPKLNSFSGV